MTRLDAFRGPVSANRARIALLLPFLAGLTVLLYQGFSAYSPFDDAYITYRYARNISSGLGFVYNAGERVLGTSTPLFTLLLAIAGLLAGPETIPRAPYWISLIADFANAFLIYRLALWVFDRWEPALMTGLVFALHAFRVNVALGGMEASLFLLFLLLAYERILVARRISHGSVFAGLALLTRIEALIAIAPLLSMLLLDDRRSAWRAVGIVAVVTAPWLVWATAYFGSPLPQSIIAKSIMYRNPPGFGLYFILTFLGTGTVGPYLGFGPVLAGSLLSAGLLGQGFLSLIRVRPAALVISMFPVLYFGLMTLANGPMYFPWYFLPVIPGLLITQVAGVWHLGWLKDRTRLRLVLILAIVLASVPALLLSRTTAWSISRDREIAYSRLCEFLQSEIQPGQTLLTPDIGVFGWCLPEVNILDPIGLVSPASIPHSSGLPENQLVSPDLVSTMRPEYVVGLGQYLNWGVTASGGFMGEYEGIWVREVMIAESPQLLYVFRRQGQAGQGRSALDIERMFR